MPARRLPWFKLWPEAMRHEKIALLSDGAFRTWVTTLAAGSEQATRWRFASIRHAAQVTGRPESELRELIGASLLDEVAASGEVWIHDWRQWQDRYASDFAPRTLRNGSANVPHSLPGELRGESKRKKETGDTSPQPPPPAEGERKPTRRRRTDDSIRGEEIVAPPPEVPPLSPLAPTDAELWARCREQLRSAMSPANWAQLIEPLEPLGRAADGGLHLRAPPGLGLDRRALHYVRRALLDQGETEASLSTICER